MRFKFLFFIFIFIFVFNIPVFADDYDYSNLSYSMAIKNSEYDTSYNLVLTINDFTFSDDVDTSDLKIYGYVYNSASIAVVSNYAFTCDFTLTCGGTDTVLSAVSSTSKFQRTYFKNGTFSWRSNSYWNANSLAGYNWVVFNAYYDDYSNCEILSTSNLNTTCFETYVSDSGDDVRTYIADDFFQCPPTLTVTSQTMSLEVVGDYLLTYLTSGVGLAILLISLLIFLTMLSRFVHHWLNL